MRFRRALVWVVVAAVLIPALTFTDQKTEQQALHTSEWLEAGGLRWRVVRAGEANSADTTLVLIHGFGDHLLGWRAIFDGLAERYRVVAFDLPGFGVSQKPDTTYTLEAMTGWVGAFLDRYTTGFVVLVGHSMGGEIATSVALAYPDRIGALVLIAPSGLNPGIGQFTEVVGERGQRAIGWWESARSFVTPVHDPDWLDEPQDLKVYNPVVDPAYRMSTTRVVRDFDFGGIGERFGDVIQPTLVIWGRLDPVIPFDTMARLAVLIPCVRVEPLPALHRPQVERPDTTLAIMLRFLDRPSCLDVTVLTPSGGGQ
ncbi:MAG: alpha/beta fold hydrolase [Gemmatimonadales bacterium]|nr:MAG: alpha/beta fold hydrolase [Gemmatimonadales bacterium]